jgi:hypothetical protein
MSRAAPPPDAASLIAAARRDLRYADAVLAAGADPLVAIVAVARAARTADEATFALLGERSARSVKNTHMGYGKLRPPTTKEIR